MTADKIQPRRWDPIVKLTHWGIVLGVIANALVTEEGSGWHIWVGYGLAGLLALRLLWGLIGPAEARFSAFPPSPSRVVAHIGEIARGELVSRRSHNPLGALMVYAIWACLAAIIASGIAMSGPPPADPTIRHEDGHRPALPSSLGMTGIGGLVTVARAEEGEEADEEKHEGEEARGQEAGEGGEEALEELHEGAVNILYLFIALHLAGVMFETRRSGRETVGAMLPGGHRPRS